MNAMPEPFPFKAEGPQPLMREIPPGASYPVEALGPLREAVAAVQDISQAPVAIAAQSALAVAALAVQGFADVETLGGDAPCSLFCLTLAESGERKSTCDRLLIRGLREYEMARDSEYREAMTSHEVAHKVWTEKRKRLIAEAAGSQKEKATAAEADLRAMGPEPRAPLLPNVSAMEPTFEGLVKLYQVGRPALGLFSDEAGGFIGGHAMNSDNRLKTMAGLSRLWNGETIDRTRAGDGATTYRGRRLAAHLMVQPVVARPLMSDPEAAGQGFLARFLMAEPPSHIGSRLRRGHAPASDAAVDRFAAHLTGILETPMPTGAHPQELAPPRLLLSAGARELLWRFHDAVERAQAPGGELEQVRAYASKATEQAARIGGVLTLWADLDAPEVTPQAMGWGGRWRNTTWAKRSDWRTLGPFPPKRAGPRRCGNGCWKAGRIRRCCRPKSCAGDRTSCGKARPCVTPSPCWKSTAGLLAFPKGRRYAARRERKPIGSCGPAMLFDVQAALTEILHEPSLVAIPAIPAIPAPSNRVKSQESQPTPAEPGNPPQAGQPSAPPSSRPDADLFRHGASVTGRPRTWTGRVVSLDAWRRLSDWERHGPDGQHWNGLTRQWEHPGGGAA